MPNMDSIRLKTKELQSKMYLTQTHRLRLIDSLDSQKRSTLFDDNIIIINKVMTINVFTMNLNEILTSIIRWRSISMRAGPAFLQFDWSKAGLSMDLPVFVYFHTKTGFKFFQYMEDIGSFFMCLEIFDFKPRRENFTGLLFCLDLSKSVKVY